MLERRQRHRCWRIYRAQDAKLNRDVAIGVLMRTG